MENKDDYDRKAENFLKKTKTNFSVKFLKTGKHFIDDKDDRDIYRVVLKSPIGLYKFNFGQSINCSGNNKKVPSSYEVLSCLTKNDVGTFSNFCSEFGYDEDSRKAERIYKAVVNEYENLKRLYSSFELELLQDIQ